MKKTIHGITVVEAMIAIAIFSLVASAGVKAFISANNLSLRAAEKTKALWLAEEGIEASRSIRDESFALLAAGPHGLLQSGNKWQYGGTSDVTDGYTRSVTVGVIDVDTVSATSTVSWKMKGTATSTVSLTSRLTNWKKSIGTQGDHLAVDTTNAYLQQSNTGLLTNMNLVTDGAFGTTTITKAKVSWTPTTPTSGRFTSIYSPNGTAVYTSIQVNGTTVTLTTPIALLGATSQPLQIQWNQSMSGKTITIVLTMSDNSTESFVVTNPPTGP